MWTQKSTYFFFYTTFFNKTKKKIFGFVKESRVFLKKIDDRVKKTNHQKK